MSCSCPRLRQHYDDTRSGSLWSVVDWLLRIIVVGRWMIGLALWRVAICRLGPVEGTADWDPSCSCFTLCSCSLGVHGCMTSSVLKIVQSRLLGCTVVACLAVPFAPIKCRRQLCRLIRI